MGEAVDVVSMAIGVVDERFVGRLHIFHSTRNIDDGVRVYSID
jgi:hypothetical protein